MTEPLSEVTRRAVKLAKRGTYALDELIKLVRYAAINAALKKRKGNISRAAVDLEMSRTQLVYWLKAADRENYVLPGRVRLAERGGAN